MKTIKSMSVILLFAALSSCMTPVLAEHHHDRSNQQDDRGHREHGHDENNKQHHDKDKKHKKHHNDGAVIAVGILLFALSKAEQKSETRDTIKRTADILIQAQNLARETGCSYGLGKAIAFQEKARFQLKKGRYEKAIVNSLWARAIAAHFLDDPEDEESFTDCDFRECELVYTYLTDKEAKYMEGAPSPIEMQDHIKGTEISDKDALSFSIDSNI